MGNIREAEIATCRQTSRQKSSSTAKARGAGNERVVRGAGNTGG